MTAPTLSVVVSTRNRAEHVSAAVASILANPGDFELIVVDQSDSAEGAERLAAFHADPRLRLLSSETRGLSRSRNVAIDASRGSILAFTDDDCRVPPDWVERVRNAFARDPSLDLVFGSVLLRAEDRALGYAAEFEPAERREFRFAMPDTRTHWGVGANMAIRRAVFHQIGTFDPTLGAGSLFPAGEEIDLTIRALAAGFKVAHVPDISVLHLGVRMGDEASRLMRGYGIGLGATFAKHARLGTPGAARGLALWLGFHGRRAIGNALRGRRGSGLGLVGAFVWGGVRSLSLAVDSQRAHFRSR